MIVAIVLALYCLFAATVLPKVLGRAAWADRAPRLAIAVWQAAGVSVVASALLSAFAVAVPASVVGHGLADLFEVCAALLGHEASPDSATTYAGLAVAGLLLLRVAWVGAAVLLRARRERRRHAEALSLLGRHDGDLGALVVDYDERLAYCLPGRKGHAVITTGTLRSLAPEQVAAVLAHEQAHLRGRHHLLLAAAEALARAFPRVPLFSRARLEVARLVELLADDVAARRHQRIHLATALVGLATGKVPSFALGAGGQTALTRVRRMLHPQAPLGRRERLAGRLAVAALLAGPAVLAAAPGVAAFLAHHCHSLLAG
ncbi:M56 family metallopeptidase [Nonomuraea gerenzanensis]|uniref:Peptidase M48, Ste24p n=1 Tax=Nonomuraea gerenzanensis TaxID=93944 RepID=A0A1M4EN13_9ACTN|nr:M56 family metallopeptidase [Nonomuraea gerenzanensis]UBU11477.1 M56 family metallopeptidase [Nonomuraea gerenzanensis]SBO99963.1 Peptidase M48, Ste24p precursor [Nonomuraea gerenzanensis]